MYVTRISKDIKRKASLQIQINTKKTITLASSPSPIPTASNTLTLVTVRHPHVQNITIHHRVDPSCNLATESLGEHPIRPHLTNINIQSKSTGMAWVKRCCNCTTTSTCSTKRYPCFTHGKSYMSCTSLKHSKNTGEGCKTHIKIAHTPRRAPFIDITTPKTASDSYVCAKNYQKRSVLTPSMSKVKRLIDAYTTNK